MITLQQVEDAWVGLVVDACTPEGMVRLYTEDGLSGSQIARLNGLHRSTVNRVLAQAGVTRTGTGGAPRRAFCKRGHDMSIHRVEIPPERGGGGYCSECKRIRERKA